MDDRKIPEHVAIIMDGNGRWAKKRGLPRKMGHVEGCKTVEKMVEAAARMGIGYLTVYGFSTENWKRPADEVASIMRLLEKYLHEAIETMARDKVKMAFFGDLAPLAPHLQALCHETEEISKGYDGCQVNICLNYGGRDEVLRAAKSFALDCAEGRADPSHLTEDAFGRYLYSAGVPDPDLVIRPSGEVRVSNFLLWQCAYAEWRCVTWQNGF